MQDSNRKAEVEAKRKAEEGAKAEDEARRQAEDVTRRKAEEEAKKAEEDARRKAEEDAKRKAEDEAKRQAEDVTRRKAEEEAKRKAEQEAKRDLAFAVKPGSGQSFRDRSANGQPCSLCPEMVLVPAGEFVMGSPASEGPDFERPQHKVAIAEPFAVGKFEVTFQEWETCVAANGCSSNKSPNDWGWGRGTRPVISVSWNDAKEYVTWLSRYTGKAYRLLTEAEWEYAARAGTTTPYSTGNSDISRDKAQFSARQTVEVGRFPANGWGCHDMHGNVWEWVEDNWHPDYRGAPQDGLVWPSGEASLRVVRGGSWRFNPHSLRSAARIGLRSVLEYNDVGFRVARTL